MLSEGRELCLSEHVSIPSYVGQFFLCVWGGGGLVCVLPLSGTGSILSSLCPHSTEHNLGRFILGQPCCPGQDPGDGMEGLRLGPALEGHCGT